MSSKTRGTALHERYDWLDQARGVVVLMLIVSMSTAEYAGDVLTREPALGPPMLNHGYDYYDGHPAIITLVDSGQALFMFMMGVVGYTAFTSRLRRRGHRSALLYAMRRFFLLYALGFLEHVGLRYLASAPIRWGDFFYKGTFAMLALGALAAFATIAVCPKAERRMAVGIALIAFHALLYAFPIFDHRGWYDDVIGLTPFPFGTIGMCAVAIAGTSFGQWLAMDPEKPLAGFQRRIAPVTMAAIIAAYCLDWVQPAQHHDANAALQLQAIGIGGMTLMMFYSFGIAGIRFPLLSSLGKNLLLLFAIGGLFTGAYLDQIPKSFLLQSPYLALLLVGIFPLVVLSLIAIFLDRRGIMVRA